ncbi:MAG: cytochrome c biogenesis protein CcsA [Phycisphaeraceae bacterium]|nr:cytochrome c biogenesis protein CcsA [Phycisphaeraceae bacterium]
MRHKWTLFTVLALSASFVCGQAMAARDAGQQALSVDVMSDMPVLENGRVKPFDTFARNVLLQLSGRRRYQNQSAASWLAELLYAPQRAAADRVFLINDPQVAIALGLMPQKKRRYSFAEIRKNQDKLTHLYQSASSVNTQERGAVENEILRIFNNFMAYRMLSVTFAFAIPHPDFSISDPVVAELLGLPKDIKQFSFLDILLKADRCEEILTGLTEKGVDQSSDKEKVILALAGHLFNWGSQHVDMPLVVIPSAQRIEGLWHSHWAAIDQEFNSETIRSEVIHWRDAAMAYRRDDQAGFDAAILAIKQSLAVRETPVIKRQRSLMALELFYNRAHLFFWAVTGYVLALLGFFLSFIGWRKALYRLSLGLLILGAVPHGAALASRIIIMNRPPVSSLYETFIFVSLIAVAIGIFIEVIHKQWLGIVVGSIGGMALLSIAGRYSADGDTMGMLVAVLNSNFWLLTHVLTITSGYAVCCVAGLLGHVYLIQCLTRPGDAAGLKKTHQILLGTLGLGLVLTFLGTNLGGIWADQSWGRFWGWDPKENGALMIVLWLAILLHAKAGRMIGPKGLAVGSVLGAMVVMWAWFGVNLLSIGLHAYGATSGAAYGLATYYVLELFFMGLVLCFILKRERALSPAL